MKFTKIPCRNDLDYILVEKPVISLTSNGMEMQADYACKAADLGNLLQAWYGLQMVVAVDGSQQNYEPKKFTMLATGHQLVSNVWCDGITVTPFSDLKTATAGDALHMQTGADVTGVAGGIHVPVGARGKMCADYFRLSCHFSDRDPWTEERIDLASEAGTVSISDLYWYPGTNDTDKIPPADAPTFYRLYGAWDYSIKRTRIVPDANATMRGKINDTRMYSRQTLTGLNTYQFFEPGTVLFMGQTKTPMYVPFGNSGNGTFYCPYWRLDYRFLINDHGWNKFPQTVAGASVPTWNTLVTKTGSAPYPAFKPFEEADLNDLLFDMA